MDAQKANFTVFKFFILSYFGNFSIRTTRHIFMSLPKPYTVKRTGKDSHSSSLIQFYLQQRRGRYEAKLVTGNILLRLAAGKPHWNSERENFRFV